MPVPDLWTSIDLPVLQNVVDLEHKNNGMVPLDDLMDRLGLLDRAQHEGALTPWKVAGSLQRLADGNLIRFLSDGAEGLVSIDVILEPQTVSGGEDDHLRALDKEWLETDDDEREWQIEDEQRRRRDELGFQATEKSRRIYAALFVGTPAHDARWDAGRFMIDGTARQFYLRSTPGGLRRVGAWPNPERFTSDLISILGDLAVALEKQQPENASKLREVADILRRNAMELSAALLAKMVLV